MSRKGEESRELIVATAWEMVDELGVEQLLAGVSMRNIADRMGLSPSTVSYHFAGPEDLARGMIESMIASIDLTPLEALVEIMGTIDSDMELVDMVRTSTQADWDALAERIERGVTARMLAQAGPMLENSLQTLVAPLIEQAAVQIAHDLHDVFSHLVQDLVARAVAEELALLQARDDEPAPPDSH